MAVLLNGLPFTLQLFNNQSYLNPSWYTNYLLPPLRVPMTALSLYKLTSLFFTSFFPSSEKKFLCVKLLSVTLQLFSHASDHLASITCLSWSSHGKSTVLFLILLWIWRFAGPDILTYPSIFNFLFYFPLKPTKVFLSSRCNIAQAGSVWWNKNLGSINILNPGHPYAVTPYPSNQMFSCMPF